LLLSTAADARAVGTVQFFDLAPLLDIRRVDLICGFDAHSCRWCKAQRMSASRPNRTPDHYTNSKTSPPKPIIDAWFNGAGLNPKQLLLARFKASALIHSQF
jgi:hypothetical protein